MARIVSQKRGSGMYSRVWHSYRVESGFDFDVKKLAEGIREMIGGHVVVEEQGEAKSVGLRYFLVECSLGVELNEIAGVVGALEDKIREVEEFTAPLRMLKGGVGGC